MFGISILLFWLPLFGGLIARFVGGRAAGNVGNATIAVFLPAIVVGNMIFFLASVLSGIPLLGAIAAAGAFILVILHVGPLLVGAIIGGATKS